MSTPIVKVYTLLVRNPLISKKWGTLISMTTDANVIAQHRANANAATQYKVVTRLFRQAELEKRLALGTFR